MTSGISLKHSKQFFSNYQVLANCEEGLEGLKLKFSLDCNSKVVGFLFNEIKGVQSPTGTG